MIVGVEIREKRVTAEALRQGGVLPAAHMIKKQNVPFRLAGGRQPGEST